MDDNAELNLKNESRKMNGRSFRSRMAVAVVSAHEKDYEKD